MGASVGESDSRRRMAVSWAEALVVINTNVASCLLDSATYVPWFVKRRSSEIHHRDRNIPSPPTWPNTNV